MEQPSLDETVIETLRDVMGDDFSLLVNTFLADAPQRVEELRRACAASRIAECEKPAHTLKGSSGNIGALKLSTFCADLVNHVRAGETSDPSPMVNSIDAELAVVTGLLRQRLP